MTPVETAIGDFVRQHAEAETRFLAEIVKVPSDNPPGDCSRPAEVVATLLEGLGFQVERHKVPKALVKANGMISATNLIVRRRFRQGPTIALNAHGDVVPPGSGWTHDPYGAEIVDGWLYGRGSAVSKSDIATYAFACWRSKSAARRSMARSNCTSLMTRRPAAKSARDTCSRTACRVRIWRSAPVSLTRSSTPITAPFIWRSRCLAARRTPPARRPASMRWKRRTQSFPPFMTGAAGFRHGPRR